MILYSCFWQRITSILSKAHFDGRQDIRPSLLIVSYFTCLFYMLAMQRKQLVLRIVSALVIAHFVIMVGRDDWLGVFVQWLYYKDLILTFLSVFLVIEYAYRINRYLNRRVPWHDDASRRFLLQFALVVLIPAGFAILLTWLRYVFVYEQDIIATGYFASEFLAEVLLILIVNLVLVISYLLRQRRDGPPDLLRERDAIGLSLQAMSGRKYVPVAQEEAAYIWLKHDVLYIRTFSGEKLLLRETLDHYEALLPQDLFFRANRQWIIHKNACKSYMPWEHGKIKVTLEPDHDCAVVVSQKRASRFRAWIRS